MSTAFIGTYYKTKSSAVKKAEEKNKTWRRKAFKVLKTDQGYFVVSKRQLE